MRRSTWLVAVMAASLAACGGNNPTPSGDVDSGAGADTGTAADTGPRTDARADASSDRPSGDASGPTSRASARCMTDEDCMSDALICGGTMQGFPAVGFCTNTCEGGTPTEEASQCGGRGSTCVLLNPRPTMGRPPTRLCMRACDPSARSEALRGCAPGQVCTYFWFNHLVVSMGMARLDPGDQPGCFPFCAEDSHCGMGQRCNVRTGACGTQPANLMLRRDGEPCNPMMESMTAGAASLQCRGACFRTSAMTPTQGICGSIINIRATPQCPDDPDNVIPFPAQEIEDNNKQCIIRNCRTNRDCTLPLLCIPLRNADGGVAEGMGGRCFYPTMGETGIPDGDGGTAPGDASTGDVPSDMGGSTEVGTATDAGTAPRG